MTGSAKQSIARQAEEWIASSQALLATTDETAAGVAADGRSHAANAKALTSDI
jgi:hypothetical protein